MESGWERQADFVRLDVEGINSMLAGHWPTVTDAQILTGGKLNTNYLVSSPDGSRAVLRLHVRETGSAPVERAVAERVRGRIPAAPVMAFDPDGRWTLFQYLAGESAEELLDRLRGSEVVAAAEEIGRTLAEIGQIRFARAGFFVDDVTVREPWASAYDGYFEWIKVCAADPLAASRAGQGLIASVLQSVEESEAWLRPMMGPPCLVHGDYKFANLLVESGRLSGVVDWEFAHSGSHLLDLSVHFRHIERFPVGYLEQFESGYASMGDPLPEGWKRAVRIVDFVSLLDFLARPGAGPNLISDTVRLIGDTVSAENPR